ncbi:MAG: GlxA family transcriptional regulator [Methylobacter sp.]
MITHQAPKFSNLLPQAHEGQVRPIAILAFPGVEALDVAGPMEVFTFANLSLQWSGMIKERVYPIHILAEQAGPVTTLSGLRIVADQAYSEVNTGFDTLFIPGGEVNGIVNNAPALDWIRSMQPRTRRTASVCTGAFLLAESGLLDGRQATCHWNYCQQLTRNYPAVNVQPDRIFVRDDCIYTSGGITSGIDLALALVEEDWGQELALFVARYLVVFLKRPGGQSQFSAYLVSQSGNHPDLRDLQAWIMTHLEEDHRVETLAERVAMSPRNFARLFLAETGMTPAKFVELARLDAARHFLGSTELSIEVVSDKSGFKDPERMRRAFIRQLGVNPQGYRNRFSRAPHESA